jgi:hypothetical protein
LSALQELSASKRRLHQFTAHSDFTTACLDPFPKILALFALLEVIVPTLEQLCQYLAQEELIRH